MPSYASPTAAPKAAPAKTATAPKTTTPPVRTPARTPATLQPARLPAARPLPAPLLRGTAAPARPAASPKTVAPPNAVAGVLDTVLHWLPDVALEALSEEAQSFAGYPLLTLMLGYDPFTRQQRRRTPANFLDAVLHFDHDSLELYRAVVKSGALTKAGQLIADNAAHYNLGVHRMGALLHDVADLFKNHKVDMMRHPSLLLKPFRQVGTDVFKFVAAVGPPLFELILPLLGSRGERVLRIFKQGKATFNKIVDNPRAFLRNLIDGLKMGFDQFSAKALGYMGLSFTSWLLSAFKPDGLAMPQQFDGPGLFKLGLRLLHIDADSLQQKLAKRMGPRGAEKMELLKTAGGLVHTLVTQGPGALGKELLDMAKSQLSQLTRQVLDGVRTWLYQKLVVAGLAKLASLLSPFSALFEALREAYETISFYIEKADKFAALLDTIVGALSDIANRVLAPAATKVERTLAQSLTLALDLLFRLLGLGGVPERVKDQLLKAREWIDQTIDQYLDTFIEMAVKAFYKGKQVAKDAVHTVKGWLGFRQSFRNPAGERHTLYVGGTEQHAHLMVASTPHPVEEYLQKQKAACKKLTGEERTKQEALIEKAWTYYTDNVQPSIARAETEAAAAANSPKLTVTETAQKLTDLLKDFGEMLAQIGGVDVAQLKQGANSLLPAEAHWAYDKMHPDLPRGVKTSAVQLLSVATSGGGQRSIPAAAAPPGWDLILQYLQTSVEGGQWVQMHMLSAAIGGQAESQNLVPAPHTVNTGTQVSSFENALKRLVRGPLTAEEIKERDQARARAAAKRTAQGRPTPSTRSSQDPEPDPAQKTSVVWAEVAVMSFHAAGLRNGVAYPANAFPETMKMNAGLHFYNGTEWVLDPTVRIHETLSNLALPTFTQRRLTALNDDGEDRLYTAIGCSYDFARKLIAERGKRRFTNEEDVISRMSSYSTGSKYTQMVIDALVAGEKFLQQSPDKQAQDIAHEKPIGAVTGTSAPSTGKRLVFNKD